MLGGSGGGSSSGGVAAAAAQLQAASLADGAVPSAANGTAAADSKGASGTSHDAAAAAAGGGTENGTADGGYLRYLIFDCDGVLVDSERASCEALRRAILQVPPSSLLCMLWLLCQGFSPSRA
jgi:dual specificity phosphatase 12